MSLKDFFDRMRAELPPEVKPPAPEPPKPPPLPPALTQADALARLGHPPSRVVQPEIDFDALLEALALLAEYVQHEQAKSELARSEFTQVQSEELLEGDQQ